MMLFVGSWLPEREYPFTDKFLESAVSNIELELKQQLDINRSTVADVLLEERVLNFSPILEIFVLTPDGKDVLGRELPQLVSQAYSMQFDFRSRSATESPRLHVRNSNLNGYMIVGYEGLFPMRKVLMRPGGRVLFLALLLAVSGIISFIMARFIVLPLRRLRFAEQKLASGDLGVRIAHTLGNRTDDIAKLAQDFDAMAEKVAKLLQSHKRLMRDVSHELRSPLARLQALMSIAYQTADSSATAHLKRMEKELERLDELISEILAFARLETIADIKRHPTDIIDLVQNIIDYTSLEGQVHGKRIYIEGPEHCVVDIDSGLIQSALENVVRNALRHTAEGTEVKVTVSAEKNYLRIIIEDRGPGVPERAIEKIFHPFYRVEDAGETQSGSGGIGLAIAQRCIHLHDGEIAAKNGTDGGLRVEIALPVESSISSQFSNRVD